MTTDDQAPNAYLTRLLAGMVLTMQDEQVPVICVFIMSSLFCIVLRNDAKYKYVLFFLK